ncbi:MULTISPECIES: hypothetical protein [Hahella]
MRFCSCSAWVYDGYRCSDG